MLSSYSVHSKDDHTPNCTALEENETLGGSQKPLDVSGLGDYENAKQILLEDSQALFLQYLYIITIIVLLSSSY